MPMKKTKTSLSAPVIDRRKPLVKEFIDADKAVKDYLLVRLPHVSYAIPKICLVYQSKDKATYRFRINWWREASIVQSGYYEVISSEGNLEINNRS